MFLLAERKAECIKNPAGYLINSLERSNNAEVLCSCNLLSDKPSATLWFNSNTSWVENPYQEVDNLDFNISFMKELTELS